MFHSFEISSNSMICLMALFLQSPMKTFYPYIARAFTLCFWDFFFFSCSLLDLPFWWILQLFFVPFFHKHPYTNRNCFGIVYRAVTPCQIPLFWDVCSGGCHLSCPHFFTICVSVMPRYFPDFISYFVLTPFFFKYLTSLIPLS